MIDPSTTQTSEFSWHYGAKRHMSSIPNIAGKVVQGSLSDIVELLQTELDQLLEKKARIRQNMRNLRRRLGILQANSSKEQTTRPISRRSRNRSRRTESRKIRHLHEELARSCRIAFLELGGTATVDELYGAIVRRGSFLFSLLDENPISAVIRTLTSMAESGEAVCGANSRWTYKSDTRYFE
jgi:hypothetical protein